MLGHSHCSLPVDSREKSYSNKTYSWKLFNALVLIQLSSCFTCQSDDEPNGRREHLRQLFKWLRFFSRLIFNGKIFKIRFEKGNCEDYDIISLLLMFESDFKIEFPSHDASFKGQNDPPNLTLHETIAKEIITAFQNWYISDI